jgi:hypothetical protein
MAGRGRRRIAARDGLVVVALLAAALVFGLSATSGSTEEAGRPSGKTIVDGRFGYTVRLPAAWRGAASPLVPDLLDPREILAVGNFRMPVGGGGNCGSEPVVAIRRMAPGDALVELKEVAVNRSMRRRLRAGVYPPTLSQELADLPLRRSPMPAGERTPRGHTLWYGKLTFRSSGRWFEALLYAEGRPQGRLAQMEKILRDIDFERGTFLTAPA